MATATTDRTLTVERAAIRFAQPFRIAGYVFESMPSVVARIGHGGLVGRGEAAGVYYNADDQDHMLEVIERVRPEIWICPGAGPLVGCVCLRVSK